MKAEIKTTGEVIEFDPKTPEEIMETWKIVTEYQKAYKILRDKLSKLVPEIVDARGLYEHKGYQFRVNSIQRMNYDKSILRQVFDEDLLDTFLEPNKRLVDDYLKEHLEEVGQDSTKLRASMIPSGQPYQVVRLEKL